MYWLDSCDELQILNSSKQCMGGLINYQYSPRLSREYKEQHGLELHASQVDARDKLKCSSREEVVTVDSVKRERVLIFWKLSKHTKKPTWNHKLSIPLDNNKEKHQRQCPNFLYLWINGGEGPGKLGREIENCSVICKSTIQILVYIYELESDNRNESCVHDRRG